MSTTRPASVAVAIGAAAALAAGAAWFTTNADNKPAAVPFWPALAGGHSAERNPPDNVGEAAKKADAIVLAHVTGVVEGREFSAWGEAPRPRLPGEPRTIMVNVQLTVDRVIDGSVRPGQVLNLEMFPPPQPLTIDTVRDNLPPGQLLMFLANRAAAARRDGLGLLVKPADENIWNEVSGRAVIAEGPQGLYTPLDADPHPAFLQSFNATTLEEAAQRTEEVAR